MDDDPKSDDALRGLSSIQQRVLGTLIEKGLTTPGQYPLTLKALTTGCNQSSNRDPVMNYSEDRVLEAQDALQQRGLTAEVHTSGGRAARYRHLVRKKVDLTEPQLAMLAELALRGRQTTGELRQRAGRMVPIDSLDALRAELSDLIDRGLASSDGPLGRRGVTVDHALYREGDAPPAPAPAAAPSGGGVEPRRSAAAAPAPSPPATRSAPPVAADPALRAEVTELRETVDELRDRVRSLSEALDDLRRDLGVA